MVARASVTSLASFDAPDDPTSCTSHNPQSDCRLRKHRTQSVYHIPLELFDTNVIEFVEPTAWLTSAVTQDSAVVSDKRHIM